MIYEGSRYEQAAVLRVGDARGNRHSTIYPDPYVDEQEFVYAERVVLEGERYDQMAADAYGDPELWWLIARANPEVFYPDDIPYGTVVRIPSLGDAV